MVEEITPEVIPSLLPEGEAEIQNVSIAPDGSLQILVRHTFKGRDDSFAIYADPSLSEKEITKLAIERIKERRDFLDAVMKEEEERSKREAELKGKIDALRGKRFGREELEEKGKGT